jgi:glucoamylase
VTWLRAAIGVGAAVAVGAVLVSGGSGTDSRAPEFLEVTAITGRGSRAVIDPYGDVVGLRRTSPAGRADRRWVGRARPLGAEAPLWARRMYLQSLLVLRALTNRRSGAVIAGAREGWAYVWPRDAGVVALAYAGAGYRGEARRVAHFLLGLDLDAAARFHPDGRPVEGREAQGDARGWVRGAARAAGVSEFDYSYGGSISLTPSTWRDRADYQEKDAGDYLGNAIASGASRIDGEFGQDGVLLRQAEDPESGVDSVAAWAVRPFPRPALFPAARRSLRRLVDERGGRFGIVPSEDWPEEDPWTAPTAWTAWAFAALRDRSTALALMNDLRRAATPLGLLPERVDAETGEPRSTTPLAWSHACAILALHELWP